MLDLRRQYQPIHQELMAAVGHVLETQQFILGEQVAAFEQSAARQLGVRFPGLRVAGTKDGYWPAGQESEVVAEVNASGAGLLLVALGQPRQEEFLDQQRGRLRARLAVGVGGCLDVLAGDLRPAPRWIRRLGCEWLFRCLQEPWRWRRVLSLPRFVFWVWFTKQL